MKTQAVSNQKFNGNVIFVEKSGEGAARTLGDYVIRKLGTDKMNKLFSLVKNESFDLFISKSESRPGNFIVEADVNLFEALQNRSKKGFIANIPHNKIEWFPEAAKNAISFYRNFAREQDAKINKILKDYKQTKYNVTI